VLNRDEQKKVLFNLRRDLKRSAGGKGEGNVGKQSPPARQKKKVTHIQEIKNDQASLDSRVTKNPPIPRPEKRKHPLRKEKKMPKKPTFTYKAKIYLPKKSISKRPVHSRHKRGGSGDRHRGKIQYKPRRFKEESRLL